MEPDRLWIALVTFERGNGEQNVLPNGMQGACGWMACLAEHEEEVRGIIARSLAADGLRLVEIQGEREVLDADEIAETDLHLVENLRNREPGRRTVWGGIHLYRAEGTA